MSISNFCKEDMENIENVEITEESSELSEDENSISEYETYSLNIITRWLKSKKIEYKYCQSSMLGMYLYQSGIEIKIKDETISIQTHPMIAGCAFAETLIRSDMMSDTRHATPEDLFKFIESLL
jgi:hypothetical protein